MVINDEKQKLHIKKATDKGEKSELQACDSSKALS